MDGNTNQNSVCEGMDRPGAHMQNIRFGTCGRCVPWSARTAYNGGSRSSAIATHSDVRARLGLADDADMPDRSPSACRGEPRSSLETQLAAVIWTAIVTPSELAPYAGQLRSAVDIFGVLPVGPNELFGRARPRPSHDGRH